jgi:hypothetical protein
MNRRCNQCLAGLLAVPLFVGGCATSSYAPQVVARGELTVRYNHRFELSAGGRPLTNGLLYPGLADYVRCVPQAAEHARDAQASGRRAVAFSVLGALFGLGTFSGLYGLYDRDNLVPWVIGGVASGILGVTLAGLSHRAKNHANGHAIDAMNYYNDAVGSLGATCDDLRYPAPAGPAPDGPPDGSPPPGAAPLPPAPPLPPPTPIP